MDEKFEQFLMSVVLKSLSEEQEVHAKDRLVAEGSSDLKLSSDEQLYHAWIALTTDGSGLLNEASEVQ